MPRDYCVYTPAKWGEFAGEFAHPARNFDLVVNDWTGDGRFSPGAAQAEFSFAEKGHKWPTIVAILPRIPRYRIYAFIDEDIDVSVETLNRLFTAGDALGLTAGADGAQPFLSRVFQGESRELREVDNICRNHGAISQPQRTGAVRTDVHNE